MQMSIGIVSFGIGIPRTNLEISGGNLAMLYFRRFVGDPEEKALLLSDKFCVGGKSGTFLLTSLDTDWFHLNPAKDAWLYNPDCLINRVLEVEISGAVLASRGSVDVKLTRIRENGEPDEVTTRVGIKGSGIQFSAMKIRGTALKFPGNRPESAQDCACDRRVNII